jgi:hypothetical protein
MTIRYTPFNPIGGYKPYHVAAATTAPAAAGMLLDTTSATAVSATGSATITLNTPTDGDWGQIQIGDFLIVDTGASCEAVVVTGLNVPAKTVTATFAKTHSGTYAVRLTRGTFLGSVVVGGAGSGMTLTLYNGHPNNGGVVIAAITPAAGASLEFNAVLDQGCFYTYTGTTAGDVTIMTYPSPQ